MLNTTRGFVQSTVTGRSRTRVRTANQNVGNITSTNDSLYNVSSISNGPKRTLISSLHSTFSNEQHRKKNDNISVDISLLTNNNINNINNNINNNNYKYNHYRQSLTNPNEYHSRSFLNKSFTTISSQVTNEFDKFMYYLLIASVISIILALFTLKGAGLVTIVFVLLVCCFSFSFCRYLVKWIMKFDYGTPEMQIIADYISEGANGFLNVQYKVIFYAAIITSIGLFIIYLFRSSSTKNVSNFILAIITMLSFLLGAFCSALAGYSGVWISVRVNLRVAAAASQHDYRNSFLLSFRGGSVSAILSASMCILGISLLYIIGYLIFVLWFNVSENEVPLLLGGYGFGASFVALFMQLGGGIYTKAADVGADMCGKIEQNIPEDDPRNPAVIADLVGDNVGDCAGSMADVFESIAGEMIGTMILGSTLGVEAKLDNYQLFIFFPLIIHSLDLIVSSIGIMLTIPKSNNEDPIVPMKRGYSVALVIGIILFSVVCRLMLDCSAAPNAWWHYSLCGLVGLLCAYLLVLITQYYTDYTNKPVKKIANASKTGHGTNIIAGISVGMESTGLPVIVISISLFTTYLLGSNSGLPSHIGGLFGTACGTMGMLCTAVFVLSMNNFGPIADNAGGIVEMSEQPHSVRVITDRLDAVGNVTKAATKGYAVGGSALACFLLFQAYLDEISILVSKKISSVDITKVEVMIGGLFGIMLVFLFTGWAIHSVGQTAQIVVNEVRRQFDEIKGIMDKTAKPEYYRCVSIVTRGALKEMIRPALLALLTPVCVGILFRIIGSYKNDLMLGVEVTASFLMFSTLTGLLMAIFLDNSGGAWDNAKKLIETIPEQKNTETHKAAITGDTVGDPFKDTAGPALHVVITTMSTTCLVLGPLFIGH